MIAKNKATVLAFDIYGTLVDPYSMEEHLRPIFGEGAREASELWRNKQIEYSFRRGLMQKYQNFGVCTQQALTYASAHAGILLSERQRRELLEQYARLPAYPDAEGALKALQERGYRLIAFSNGTEAGVRGLLEHAGLLDRFSTIVSVDELKTFKPAPAVYENLAKKSGVAKNTIWLVSSNPFDVIGAKACDLRAAWVQRDPKRLYDPWEYSPDLTVHNLRELTERLEDRTN
jgi:2-haloacid dehalogenase